MIIPVSESEWYLELVIIRNFNRFPKIYGWILITSVKNHSTLAAIVSWKVIEETRLLSVQNNRIYLADIISLHSIQCVLQTSSIA